MNIVIYEDVEDLEVGKKEGIDMKEFCSYDDQRGKSRGHSSGTQHQ